MNRLNSILNWSTRVGRLFGIPISLHITIIFFLLPVLGSSGLGLVYGVEFAVLLVLSILAHELGHALSAKHYRMTDLSIMLHGFGGFAMSSGYRTPKQALVIVLAGPAVTFAIGILAIQIGDRGMAASSIGTEAFRQFALIKSLGWVNILMGFLNLVPSLPFDGGRALEALLRFRLPEFRATRHVCHLGLVVTPILFIYAVATNASFMAVFAGIGFITSLQILAQTGGIRFGEVFADRRAKKEMEAQKLRERARTAAYLDDVQAREIQRKEQARLRRILEASSDSDADLDST